MYVPPTREDRFWGKVICHIGDDACWTWEGAQRGAYGNFWWGTDRGFVYAHQAAHTLQIGPIPEGMWVLHHCDNHYCVRGSHLFLGDAQTNSDDKLSKGRQARGETHGMRKLTADQVSTIRMRYLIPGVTMQMLANEFGVSVGLVHLIVNNKLWQHIPAIH